MTKFEKGAKYIGEDGRTYEVLAVGRATTKLVVNVKDVDISWSFFQLEDEEYDAEFAETAPNHFAESVHDAEFERVIYACNKIS